MLNVNQIASMAKALTLICCNQLAIIRRTGFYPISSKQENFHTIRWHCACQQIHSIKVWCSNRKCPVANKMNVYQIANSDIRISIVHCLTLTTNNSLFWFCLDSISIANEIWNTRKYYWQIFEAHSSHSNFERIEN